VERKHWTEVQKWRGRYSGRVLTAGELLALYRAELRGVSLCDAAFDVRAGGDTWERERE
jgi:hypothetical protein